MWKEEDFAQFEVLYQYLPPEKEGNNENNTQ
jgi:hypothetical protein